MTSKKKNITHTALPKMVRNNRITISLNDKEKRALERFYEKYKIQNKSKFLRETIITAILKRFDEDYPTLFDDKEMR